jgi:hypothetical protein
MALLKITGQGLTSIALLVALLWGCFIGEHLMVRQARLENARVIAELRAMQRRQRIQPVSMPVLHPPRPVRASAG